MKKSMKVLILFVMLLLTGIIFAQENVYYISYGSEALTIEGDDDYTQVFYFDIPSEYKGKFFVRIFDADCGGKNDALFGEYDSEVKYELFGSNDPFPNPRYTTESGHTENPENATFISELTVATDDFKDNRWYNFISIDKSGKDSSKIFDHYSLKISGITGNDGNIFDIFVSSSSKKNVAPEGSTVFTYKPTIRLPKIGKFAELRFLSPKELNEFTVFNFDVAGGDVAVETPFRSNLKVKASGQDAWAASTVQIDRFEQNRINSVKFSRGNEIPNDATFFILDQNGNSIPFITPIYYQKPNKRPIPKVNTKILSDCYTIVFDASISVDPDGDAMSYYWEFGDGTTEAGERIAHKYDELKSYDVRLIVTDASGQVGNSSRYEFPVKLNKSPEAVAGTDKIVAPDEVVTFDASASNDSDGKLVNYYWEFGDGSKMSGKQVSHKYENAGRYQVTLRVEDNSDSPCNFDVDELLVWVNSAPDINIGEDKIASVNQTVNFSGSESFDSDGEITLYNWEFGDGSIAEGVVVEHKYSKPGKYKVTLKITDNTSVANNSASDELFVVVNDKPVAEAGDDKQISAAQTVTFDGGKSKDADGNLTGFYWDFGDGNTKEGSKVEHAFTEPGVYEVTLKVKDDSKSTSDMADDKLTVIVNYPPVAVAGDDQYVTESELTFSAAKSSDKDGKIIDYLWEFGDNTTEKGKDIKHVYAAPGKYKVKLTVTDDSKTTTDKHSDELLVTINEKPIADAGEDKSAAPGEELTFDASGSLDPDGVVKSYTWSFGKDKEATGKSVKHTFDKPGKYPVSLKVTDNSDHNNAFDYDEIIVVVNQAPVAIAGTDKIAAPGDDITFDASLSKDLDGSIEAYEWSFSDNKSGSNKKVVTRSFDNPGIYNATLKVTDNSGVTNAVAYSKIGIIINNAPLAKLPRDILTCESTVMFTGINSVDADGDALSYYWNFGDGTPADTGAIIYHTYEKSGTYPVVLTVDDSKGLKNSTNSASFTVTINESPVADAGENKVVCAGDIVLFDGSGTIDPENGLIKYEWDFGDGTKAEGINPTKIYKNGGSYQVTLFVKDDSGLPCNTDVDQMMVTVAEAPVARAGNDTSVCANTLVQFDGTASTDLDGVVNSYLWDFGDGSIGGGATPTHVYSDPGVYRALLTITGDLIGNCDNTDKDEIIVTVLEAPEAKFTFERAAAVNTPVYFDGSVSDGKGALLNLFEWDFGDGSKGTGETVSHSYTKPGKYFVKLNIETDAQTSCFSSPYQDYVIINGAPVANAGKDQFMAVDQQVVFNGLKSEDKDGSIMKYDWDFGDGSNDSGAEVKHIYKSAGKFDVILRVTDNTNLGNNFDYDTTIVTINDSPVPVISCSDWGKPNNELLFSAASSIDSDSDIKSYHWNFGDGKTETGENVKHTYKKAGKYNVTLTVDDGTNLPNSVNSLSKSVNINSLPFVSVTSEVNICPGEILNLGVDDAYDADGEITAYTWNFGGGVTYTGKNVEHTYSESGIFEVKLCVYDNSNLEGYNFTERNIKVIVNSTPVAEAGDDKTVNFEGVHDFIVFDASESRDLDGDPLSFTWDFGDGNKKSGKIVTHKYSKAGTYKVTLTVKDDSGTSCDTSADTLTVVVKKRN